MAKRKRGRKSARKVRRTPARKSSVKRGGRHASNKSKVSKVRKLMRLAKQRRLKRSSKKVVRKRKNQ
ncbi:MAG: hypothetical protein Q8R53_03855 [Nanoarchaeota archaeon]|nr:hypothetical protein [Nanoarchaeota archaeon]